MDRPIPCKGLITHASDFGSSCLGPDELLTNCPSGPSFFAMFTTKVKSLGNIKTGAMNISVTSTNLTRIPQDERDRNSPLG